MVDLCVPMVIAFHTHAGKTNRIFHRHRSPIQTEKSLSEGKRMMPETRFSEFPALSVDSRVGISLSASETDDWLFFLPIL